MPKLKNRSRTPIIVVSFILLISLLLVLLLTTVHLYSRVSLNTGCVSQCNGVEKQVICIHDDMTRSKSCYYLCLGICTNNCDSCFKGTMLTIIEMPLDFLMSLVF